MKEHDNDILDAILFAKKIRKEGVKNLMERRILVLANELIRLRLEEAIKETKK